MRPSVQAIQERTRRRRDLEKLRARVVELATQEVAASRDDQSELALAVRALRELEPAGGAS